MAGDDQPIIAKITEELTPSLSLWFGPDAIFAETHPDLSIRRWSFFLRYPIALPADASKHILVKIPRQPEMQTLEEAVAAQHLRATQQQEYEMLRAMAEAFSEQGNQTCCAIRPLTYLTDWNALVTEELSAQPLKDLIMRPQIVLGRPRSWFRLETALTGAGRWLRIFHEQLGALRTEPLSLDMMQREVDQTLDRLVYTSVVQPVDLTSVRASANRIMAGLLHEPVPTAILHGDFNCANILVTPDMRVTALDNNNSLRAPVYNDLAKLITDLATRKVQVFSQGLFVPGPSLARCQHAILAGYFADEPYNIQVLNFACALAVIRKWALDEQALLRAAVRFPMVVPLLRPLLRRYFWQVTSFYLRAATPVDSRWDWRGGLKYGNA
jgi:hypothetical protein